MVKQVPIYILMIAFFAFTPRSSASIDGCDLSGAPEEMRNAYEKIPDALLAGFDIDDQSFEIDLTTMDDLNDLVVLRESTIKSFEAIDDSPGRNQVPMEASFKATYQEREEPGQDIRKDLQIPFTIRMQGRIVGYFKIWVRVVWVKKSDGKVLDKPVELLQITLQNQFGDMDIFSAPVGLTGRGGAQLNLDIPLLIILSSIDLRTIHEGAYVFYQSVSTHAEATKILMSHKYEMHLEKHPMSSAVMWQHFTYRSGRGNIGDDDPVYKPSPSGTGIPVPVGGGD